MKNSKWFLQQNEPVKKIGLVNLASNRAKKKLKGDYKNYGVILQRALTYHTFGNWGVYLKRALNWRGCLIGEVV